MTRRRRRPSLPPRPLAPLATLLVVVLVGLCACTDAHNQAQLDLHNQGYDPTAVVILAPTNLGPALRDLGTAYTKAHPSMSFVLVSDVTAGLEHLVLRHHNRPAVAANAKVALDTQPTPQLWIDTSNAQRHLLPATVVVSGPPLPFGREQLVLVVRAGNPDRVTGLRAFAPGSGVKTGICLRGTVCGSLTTALFAAAHLEVKPFLGERAPNELLTDLLQGRVQAVLTTGTDAALVASKGAAITTVPIGPASQTFVNYQTLRIDGSPTASAFAEWLAHSPQAASIMVADGLAPPVRPRA